MSGDADRRGGWRDRVVAVGMVVGLLSPTALPRADEAAGLPPPPAYWQAPPLPQAVIQGGAIPPGWQPQAVPYQGLGPDGRPITMYFAPTYVFTYQAGPPSPAIPQGGRRQGWGRAGAAAPPMGGGWNYATSGVAPAQTTLPPGGVTPYRAVYRFPPDARALQGTDLVPPGSLPAVVPPPTEPVGSPVGQPVSQPPPTQWMPSEQQSATPWGPAAAAASASAVTGIPAEPTPPPLEPIQPSEPPPPLPPVRQTWRVVGVADGDTVSCLDESGQQRRLNLAGIDAPEAGQDHARESREALAGMVFGRVVEVAETGRDAAGRSIGRIFVDGDDVGRRMVATGNATCDPATADADLTAAQDAARSLGVGVWSAQPSLGPAG